MFKTLSPEAKNTTIENEKNITVGSIVPAVQCIVVLIRFTKSATLSVLVLWHLLIWAPNHLILALTYRDATLVQIPVSWR